MCVAMGLVGGGGSPPPGLRLCMLLPAGRLPKVLYQPLTLDYEYGYLYLYYSICVAGGCTGCTCTPRAEKKLRPNLQGKVHPARQNVHPGQTEQESIFRKSGDLYGGSG